MQAKLSVLPAHDVDWAFEAKWDGVRALVYSDAGRVRVQSRNLHDLTANFPELLELGLVLKNRSLVLDGEIIAPLANGRASFERLQGRLGLGTDAAVSRKMETVTVVYIIFDLLYLDGHSTMQLPYAERRRLLEQLKLAGPFWRTPAYHVGDGGILLEAARGQNLEGIVAKRLNSRYEPGKRTGAWLKIKLRRRQEFVIGGWSEGAGGRRAIGSLMVGYYNISSAEARADGVGQRLVYAGNVGTGFTAEDAKNLSSRLAPLRRDSSPFFAARTRPGSFFVEPELVGEFEFAEWTSSGTLRQPSFKGLRLDKDPLEVVREEVN